MSKLSHLGERGEPRERAAKPPPLAFRSSLACLSCVYFSRYSPNGELARRLERAGSPLSLLFFALCSDHRDLSRSFISYALYEICLEIGQ